MTGLRGTVPGYRTLIPVLSLGLLASLPPVCVSTRQLAQAQTTPQVAPQGSAASAELTIGGAVSTTLTLAVVDLKKMPRKILSVANPHSQKTEVYEGVLVEELLRRAGVTQGEQLKGAAMASYVVAEASDGYRVAFSLAELDSGILDSEVIVADTMDGAPLGEKSARFAW